MDLPNIRGKIFGYLFSDKLTWTSVLNGREHLCFCDFDGKLYTYDVDAKQVAELFLGEDVVQKWIAEGDVWTVIGVLEKTVDEPVKPVKIPNMNDTISSFVAKLREKGTELQGIATEMIGTMLDEVANSVREMPTEKAASLLVELLEKNPAVKDVVVKRLFSSLTALNKEKAIPAYKMHQRLPARHSNGRFKKKQLVARFDYSKDGRTYEPRTVVVKDIRVGDDRVTGWDLNRAGLRSFIHSKIRGGVMGIKFSSEYV